MIANFVATYTVTPSVGAAGGGTISPSTAQTVTNNQTTSFTLTPDAGYGIASVGGTCGGTLAGNTYTTNAITANCTVIANFTLIIPNNGTAIPTLGQWALLLLSLALMVLLGTVQGGRARRPF